MRVRRAKARKEARIRNKKREAAKKRKAFARRVRNFAHIGHIIICDDIDRPHHIYVVDGMLHGICVVQI